MHAVPDGLRISPRYTSADWESLSRDNPSDWVRAAEIVRDRLEGRFLRFADICLPDPFSGFVVLSIDCLLAETVQQFRLGMTDGKNKSGELIRHFLAGPRFQPDFDEQARKRFYLDIRCGLLHQAEAKEMWLLRRGQAAMLQPTPQGDGYIIDVIRFHYAIRDTFNDYCQEIVDPSQDAVRENLWTKMEHISRIRVARGALLEAGTDAASEGAT